MQERQLFRGSQQHGKYLIKTLAKLLENICNKYNKRSDNLFQPQFYFVELLQYVRNTYILTSTSECFLFTIFLGCKVLNKNLPFVFLCLQKIRCPALVSYKLELGIPLIIRNIFLKVSTAFQNTESAFERCSTILLFCTSG